MTLDEILAALDQGKTVCWGNPGYIVIRDVASHQPYVKCLSTGHITPLFRHTSPPRLAGKEEDFFILEQPGDDEGSPDGATLSLTFDEVRTLRQCLEDCVGNYTVSDEGYDAFESLLDKAEAIDPPCEDPPFQDFSASVLGL